VKPATLVVDAETGKVLVATKSTALWYPASLTKLMTAYLTFGEIAAGRLAMDTQITVSAAAAAEPPTKFGFRTGQKLTVQQALSAMLVVSANDAAVALAEAIGSTESGFVEKMNGAAQKLGMVSTRYQNATGLPADGQVTTARDQAVLALALIREYPSEYSLFGLRQATVAGRTLPTVNGMLGAYPGFDGMKTGFTCGSGYNMVGSAEKSGERLVAVVLGAGDRNERAALMRKLLDSGFAGGESVPAVMAHIDLIPAGLETASPPTVLNGSKCAAADDSDAAGPSSRFSGWGVIFGAYTNTIQAQHALTVAQLRLKGIASGRTVVVERQYEGARHYTALMVGLDPNVAGRACKALWQEQQYCLALNPKVLNDPSAMWR